MFDIGFWELLIIAVVVLLVLGPERLPEVAKQAAFFVRKARQGMFRLRNEMKSELDGSPFGDLQEAKREMSNFTNDMKQFGRDLADSHEETLTGEEQDDTPKRTSNIRQPDDERYPWEEEAKEEFAAAKNKTTSKKTAAKKTTTKKKASKKQASKATSKKATKKVTKKVTKKASKKVAKKAARKVAKKTASKKKATKKSAS